MKKSLKLVTGLFLGVIVAASASSAVKAETVYYVKADGVVTAQDSVYTYMMADLPEGAIIPAGSTVYVEGGMANTALEAQLGLLEGIGGIGLVQYKSVLPSQVTYDNNNIQLTYSVNPGVTGTSLISQNFWDYGVKMNAIIAENQWNWAVNGWKAWAAPCWTAPVCAPAPCWVAPVCAPAPCWAPAPCAPQWTLPVVQPYTAYDYQNAVQEMCTAFGMN